VQERENGPAIPEHQIDVWDAFWVLHDSRPVGMAPGGIPLTEIEAYLRMYDIRDPDLIDEWLTLIREMDREYLKVSGEQRES
jgi:hypothetical protein